MSGAGSGWSALLTQLYGLSSRGIQPGLERVRAALAAAGDPQDAFEVVHVAGTNGKGSVVSMIAEGITDRRVGRFTSPHLHSLTERFVVDGEPVSRRLVIETWDALREPLARTPLTFFEAATVLAFVIFERAEVQLAVVETGLGGRLDSTNVCGRVCLTALTRIALDHQAWLGDDLASIAKEKAGIMRPGVPCIVGPQEPAAESAILASAGAIGAPVVRALPSSHEPLALDGAHQRENYAIASTALGELREQGVGVDVSRAARATWPGRLERIDGQPELLLDIAHNPNAVAALAAHLSRLAPPRARGGNAGAQVLVFGAMRDKDWARMLELLRPHFDAVVLTKASLERAREPAQMADRGELVEPDVETALNRARELASTGGRVVVTGSSFVVAEARACALELPRDPPIAF